MQLSLGELIMYIARNNCCRCFCDNDNTSSCRGGICRGVEQRIEPFKYYINLKGQFSFNTPLCTTNCKNTERLIETAVLVAHTNQYTSYPSLCHLRGSWQLNGYNSVSPGIRRLRVRFPVWTSEIYHFEKKILNSKLYIDATAGAIDVS